MKITTVVVTVAMIGAGLTGFLLMPDRKTEEPDKTQNRLTESKPDYPLRKNISYTYRLTNSSPEQVETADFYAYTPIPRTPFQQLENLQSNQAYQLLRDKFGNQIIHFKVAAIAPYASKIIKLKVALMTADKANHEEVKNRDSYLENTALLNLDKTPVINLAAEFEQPNQYKLVEEIFQWTMRSIRYGGYESSEKPVLETLRTLAGDCTDYMHVFTALSRSKGIPTREIGGYVVRYNKVLQAEDYHNWAEYHLDDTWYLSDPQNKILNKNAGNYIAFRHYGNDPQSPLNNYHRYHATDQRLRISMN